MNPDLSPKHIANARPRRPACRRGAFTLLELVVVVSIMLLMFGFAAPSIIGALKGKKTEQAISAFSGILEAARLDAITQNTYVWVGVLNKANSSSSQTPSGQDEVWLMSFRVNKVLAANSTLDESRVPSTGGQMLPASVLRRAEGVSLVSFGSLPATLQTNVTTLFGSATDDFSAQTVSSRTISWNGSGSGSSAIAAQTFSRLALFTPRGEALLEDGSSATVDDIRRRTALVFGIARTVNGSPLPNDRDMAAIVLSGATGRVTAVRP